MDEYITHIKSKSSYLDINFHEIFRYKYLAFLFYKRNYTTRYKQTILGPIWLILNPLLTVTLYSIVFGRIAHLSTDGIPPFVFYLCSNSIWTFFSTSLTQISHTFTDNAKIMGKVYFPRLIMPISSVLTGLLDLIIQLAMLFFIMTFYSFKGFNFHISYSIILVPILIIQVGLLGLGFGIIIASLTTKYRDLAVLVSFGVQLWMYISPVVYTSSLVPSKYMSIYMINPMAPILECWRNIVIGSGVFLLNYWIISLFVTGVVLLIGVIIFNKIEKTFMDTV